MITVSTAYAGLFLHQGCHFIKFFAINISVSIQIEKTAKVNKNIFYKNLIEFLDFCSHSWKWGQNCWLHIISSILIEIIDIVFIPECNFKVTPWSWKETKPYELMDEECDFWITKRNLRIIHEHIVQKSRKINERFLKIRNLTKKSYNNSTFVHSNSKDILFHFLKVFPFSATKKNM